MSKVIVLASGKGGTGKSSVCVGLALAFAKMGRRVLIIDCDSCMRGSDIMLGINSKVVFDISDVVSGNCNYKDAIYQNDNIRNISLLAAPSSLDNEVSSGVMMQIVNEISPNYDYILIDAPAGLGSGFTSAVSCADEVIIVVNAEPTSMRGCENVKKALYSMDIKNVKFILNKFDVNDFTKSGVYADIDEIIDKCELQMLGIVLQDSEYRYMLENNCSKFRKSNALTSIECITRRIEGENVPLSVSL